jgi:hypothetical protein
MRMNSTSARIARCLALAAVFVVHARGTGLAQPANRGIYRGYTPNFGPSTIVSIDPPHQVSNWLGADAPFMVSINSQYAFWFFSDALVYNQQGNPALPRGHTSFRRGYPNPAFVAGNFLSDCSSRPPYPRTPSIPEFAQAPGGNPYFAGLVHNALGIMTFSTDPAGRKTTGMTYYCKGNRSGTSFGSPAGLAGHPSGYMTGFTEFCPDPVPSYTRPAGPGRLTTSWIWLNSGVCINNYLFLFGRSWYVPEDGGSGYINNSYLFRYDISDFLKNPGLPNPAAWPRTVFRFSEVRPKNPAGMSFGMACFQVPNDPNWLYTYGLFAASAFPGFTMTSLRISLPVVTNPACQAGMMYELTSSPGALQSLGADAITWKDGMFNPKDYWAVPGIPSSWFSVKFNDARKVWQVVYSEGAALDGFQARVNYEYNLRPARKADGTREPQPTDVYPYVPAPTVYTYTESGIARSIGLATPKLITSEISPYGQPSAGSAVKTPSWSAPVALRAFPEMAADPDVLVYGVKEYVEFEDPAENDVALAYNTTSQSVQAHPNLNQNYVENRSGYVYMPRYMLVANGAKRVANGPRGGVSPRLVGSRPDFRTRGSLDEFHDIFVRLADRQQARPALPRDR